MSKVLRIPGRRGTLAPRSSGSGATGTATIPAVPAAAVARLVRVNGNLFVELDGKRIPVEPENGQPAPGTKIAVSASAPAALRPAIEAVAQNRAELLRNPKIADVRAGYLFKDGAITATPAVVVAVLTVPGGEFDKAKIARDLGIPNGLSGIPVDIEIADPFQRLARTGGTESALLAERPSFLIDEVQRSDEDGAEAVPVITYKPPAGGNLNPVTGPMTITCHVSPDAGWRVLKPFLEGTERKLHVGMYDFTAPHIYRTTRTLLKESEVEWQQVLGPNESLPKEDDVDSTKADDLPESSIIKGLRRVASDRFTNAFARVGSGRTFASAYHIKVAVRDDRAFWLSSGNWQSSNQPDIDFFDENADRQLISRYNREWHVVCESPVLAKRFQRFLDHDFETASMAEEAAIEAAAPLPELLIPVDELLEEEKAAVGIEVFAPQKFTFTTQSPLTVQPILTPDNYLQVVLEFLRRRPKRTLYFQNQSLNPNRTPTPEYAELMELLAKYSNDEDLDVRFIFRNIGSVRKKLESLQAAGFNMSRIRMQGGCHTKGIIVDSEKILVGSHNITNEGVQANRDASLLIEHGGIAQYFEKVFLHDWEKLSRPTIREEAVPIPAGSEEAAALNGNLARVPFSYFVEE